MHHGRWSVGIIALLVAGFAQAGSKEVHYAPVPDWVAPAPMPTGSPTPTDAQLRIVYSDVQINLGSEGDDVFNAYRVKVLQPQALNAGNITLTWNPDVGDAQVHYVRIIRDSEVIDVLKTTGFQVLQREGFLEQSILNGDLTAALQVPGLQVGDELEFAGTIRRRDPTLGDHSFGFSQLPATSLPGAFRIRITWPKDKKITWRTTHDVPKLLAKVVQGRDILEYELRDPSSAIVADGAPARVNLRRFIEYSDFNSWPDVSQRIWPLFEKAAVLKPDSPIRKEVARIAATSTDPATRVEGALQLVQDRVRYVYIGMNGSNFTPATADETWERRFGDCKAKSALLIAVLRELGIPAEAILVNSRGGDGTDERLPSPGLFDHVLVRASVGDTSYWLDGSRLGDKRLALLAPPSFRWALPVRSGGSELEKVPTNPPNLPDAILVIDADAGKGFDQKATIKVQQILRGNTALEIHSKLMVMSAADANNAVRSYWRKTNAWIEPTSVSWRFDEQRATLLLNLTGEGKLDWTGDDTDGHSLQLFGAGFSAPPEYHRPKEQDQSAPWITNYPEFKCWATAIHLPPFLVRWAWDYHASPVNSRMGGVDYWRTSDLRDSVIRTVMSKRAAVPEITAVEAEDVNKRLLAFDNTISSVYQILTSGSAPEHDHKPEPPFGADTDWSSPDAPCSEPAE